ncbi:MAG: hypothetical protein CMM50_05545 [Rhodospirillaceae bacterium]|nr:hypothetical protein [Rhodospirillaceae bacterium]
MRPPSPDPAQTIRPEERNAEQAASVRNRRLGQSRRPDPAAIDDRSRSQGASQRPSLFTEDGRSALDTGAGKPPFLASILFRVQQFAQEFLTGRKTPSPDEATQGTEAYHAAYRLGQSLFGARSTLEMSILVPNGPVDIVV